MALADPGAFLDWCTRLAETPIGEVHGVSLSHFLKVNSVQLCGGGLPPVKILGLEKFLTPAPNRLWLSKLLDDLTIQAPALYVGEADRLPDRVTQHIRGETGFGIQVNESDQLDWPILNLYYCDLGTGRVPKDQLTALEYLVALIGIAGMTARPG